MIQTNSIKHSDQVVLLEYSNNNADLEYGTTIVFRAYKGQKPCIYNTKYMQSTVTLPEREKDIIS